MTKGRHGFIAFIDESGQEGGRGKGGSSDFFIISAAIARTTKGWTPISDALAAASKRLGKGPGHRLRKYSLETKANRRHIVLSELSEAKIAHVTVIAHKDSFTKQSMTDDHGKLYFFVSHLLLERISWACRDAHKAKPSADGRAAILFSRRTTLSYDAFQGYAKDIRDGNAKYPSKAEWEHLDLDAIWDRPHSEHCDGLLAADYIASSFGNALEANPHGLRDDRHVRALARNVYRYRDKCWANGVKLFPPEAEPMAFEDPRFFWFKAFFGK